MGYCGYRFTWSNKSYDKEHIEERLDGFMCNERWYEMWPEIWVQNIVWEGSDHYLIIMDTEAREWGSEEKDRVKKFEAFWVQDVPFRDVVTETWHTSRDAQVGLFDKLVSCGESFGDWSDVKYGAVAETTKNLRQKFRELCKAEPTAQNIQLLKKAETELLEVERLNEIFWAQ